MKPECLAIWENKFWVSFYISFLNANLKICPEIIFLVLFPKCFPGEVDGFNCGILTEKLDYYFPYKY